MTKIKTSSTIQYNKQNVFKLCPITYGMEKIGSYWKPIILFHLLPGSRRYGELKKAMPHITEKMLIQHLRQLEADGLITRIAIPVVPPKVTYKLTRSGLALRPVLHALANWAMAEGKSSEEKLFRHIKRFPIE